MRIRSDLKFGTITDNPLAIGAVTVNSAQFSTLPTVAGTDELYLTLDPEGSNREIVRVTAHAAAATSVTVQRGQLGTAAAQHALSTRWAHGIVTTDLTVPCTSSTRPTVGLWAGMRIYETDTGREYVYTGTGWTVIGDTGAWTFWTPTLLNSAGAVTKTVDYARYTKIGRTCQASCKLTATGAGALGDIRVTLPVSAAAGFEFVGTMHFFDASANSSMHGGAFIVTSDRVMLIRDGATGNGAVATALAVGDIVWISVAYETGT